MKVSNGKSDATVTLEGDYENAQFFVNKTENGSEISVTKNNNNDNSKPKPKPEINIPSKPEIEKPGINDIESPNLEIQATQLEKDLSLIYVLAYNRAADKDGLKYWADGVIQQAEAIGNGEQAYINIVEDIISGELFEELYDTQNGHRAFI